MGWIEEKYGGLPYWDDRYQKPLDHLPYWDDRVAGEGGEDEVQRHSKFVLEGDHYDEPEEPGILEQADRIMREEERRARRRLSAEPVAWALPLADDKVTFVNEPVIGDDGDTSGVEDSRRLQADREWDNVPETPETAKKKEPINWQELEDETLWYEVAELYGLGEMGVYDPERLAELFELHKKVRNYGRLLEEVRDCMDEWIDGGMQAKQGSSLEDYIIDRSKKDLTRPYPWPGESELERGKRMIRRVWLHFRGHVNHAIDMTREPGLVSLDPRVSWVYGADGLNNPYSPGFALHPRVLTYRPELCMILIIHEGMHDSDRLGYGHTNFGKWKHVEEDIGWRVQGDWQESLDKLRSYLWNIMYRMRLQPGPENMHSKNRWEAALRKSGIEKPR